MKKVLEVFGEPISRGGQESYVISALQNMDLSNLSVDLFTPYFCDNQDYIEYINSIGGKVVHIDLPFKVGGTRREIIPYFEEYLNKNKYDVVHIHSGSISVLAYYARTASKNGINKVIVHSHSSGVKENLKHFLMKIYASGMFKMYATDFCACSMEAAKWKFPKSVLSKVKILNNGVDLEKYKFDSIIRQQMRNSYGIKDDELVLGHVGRFTHEKNQIFLIDIFKEYVNRIGDAKLVLVGDGVEIKSVKNRAKELRIDEKIIFAGARNNVSEYMNMFDIFLFPSLYEGLGIVGIEAQAAGLPVIASKGIPEMMKASDNVCFISLDNTAEWIKDINRYRNKTRFNNTESIRNKGFDIKETSKVVLEMYMNS
ncbi:MAG: glycosyltransferase family 1 protein [Candidatus Methanofastidiosa archaeon]|nr:glycosyltransferase family 1 protein [Candidatus Methanofastidiosa archaeon]